MRPATQLFRAFLNVRNWPTAEVHQEDERMTATGESRRSEIGHRKFEF
jgi:hypothetical protein